MALWTPSTVVPSVLLRREHKSQAAVALIADHFRAAEVWPPTVQLVGHRRVVEVRGSNHVLEDVPKRGHPGMQLEAIHVALSPKAPPCARKRAAFPALGTADWKRHRVNDNLNAAPRRTHDLFQTFKETLTARERLGEAGKTVSVFPEQAPPDRRERVLEHQARQQERDQQGIADLLVNTPLAVAEVLSRPTVKRSNDLTTA